MEMQVITESTEDMKPCSFVPLVKTGRRKGGGNKNNPITAAGLIVP